MKSTAAKFTMNNQEIIFTVLSHVSQKLNIPSADIISKSRKRPFVDARRVVSTVLYDHTPIKLDEIGSVLGGRDHASIIHHRRSFYDLLHCKDDSFCSKWELIDIVELLKLIKK